VGEPGASLTPTDADPLKEQRYAVWFRESLDRGSQAPLPGAEVGITHPPQHHRGGRSPKRPSLFSFREAGIRRAESRRSIPAFGGAHP
jgi:hypothetical protein